MEYPALVYRCPGAHFGPNGTTYDYLDVKDEAELRAALENGWSESIVKAVYVHLNESEPDESVGNVVSDVSAAESEESGTLNTNDESAPPTRAELEEKASELGIKFDGRTTDRKLLEKIEEVLRGE